MTLFNCIILYVAKIIMLRKSKVERKACCCVLKNYFCEWIHFKLNTENSKGQNRNREFVSAPWCVFSRAVFVVQVHRMCRGTCVPPEPTWLSQQSGGSCGRFVALFCNHRFLSSSISRSAYFLISHPFPKLFNLRRIFMDGKMLFHHCHKMNTNQRLS